MKAVLDIGKTHIKLQLVDDAGSPGLSYQRQNAPVITGDYPFADTDTIWQWLVETLKSCPETANIKAISITTHGATAALVNINSEAKDGLVMPILDYEFNGPDQCEAAYQRVRPDFSQTLSPALPAGLNLGKQLFWLQHQYTEAFARASHLLLYPQYWAWRLSGVLATEVTSLGCHTDMWMPFKKTYSALMNEQEWLKLMPPIYRASDCLGTVLPSIAAQTGLPENCQVYTGIHDSNASYLRYLISEEVNDNTFTVISSGTWTILMQAGGNSGVLDANKDMLANVDMNGDPVACARFMGGREYEHICQLLGGDISMTVTTDDVAKAITNQWMVTPDFSGGNGPFGGAKPQIACPNPAPAPQAIATLYCALLIDQRLTDLQATGPVYIEGAFLKNPLLCALVAQLRDQPVWLSTDNTGTVQGAGALAELDSASTAPLSLMACKASTFNALTDYKAKWYHFLSQ